MEVTQPIIINLGRRKSKAIKALKSREGKLWQQVADVFMEAQKTLGAQTEGKVIIPVVMIYAKKQKRRPLDRLIAPKQGRPA